jgi:hypothetical protein
MKALTLVLGAAIAATTSSQLRAMPIQPLSECHWYGRGPYPGGYYGPYHRPY